jgi:ABC-type phosphate transport system auxiliary subunit
VCGQAEIDSLSQQLASDDLQLESMRTERSELGARRDSLQQQLSTLQSEQEQKQVYLDNLMHVFVALDLSRQI